MGNNSIYRINYNKNYYSIAIIISHDFGLPTSSQWQNIVLLQLNNSLINPWRTELVFQNSSHFHHWHLCCIYLGHRSLSLPQTWLLFRHGVLLLSTCLPGLESPQTLRRIKSNASFDWNWGEQNDPTACWDQLHPRFRVLQQGKCLSYPPDCVGRVTETRNCVGGEWDSPFQPPLTRGHPV